MLFISWLEIQDISKFLFGALCCFLMVFGIDFLLKYKHADKFIRTDAAYQVFYMIGAGLFGYGIYEIAAAISHVYNESVFSVGMQFLFPIIILSLFTVLGEGLLFREKTMIHFGPKRVGTFTLGIALLLVYAVVLVIVVIITSMPPPWMAIAVIPVYILYVVYGALGFLTIVKVFFVRLRPQTSTRKKVAQAMTCAVVAFVANMVVRSYGRLAQNEWYLAGLVLELAAWYFGRHFMLQIPSYDEFEWRSGLVEVHVVHAESGISIYYESFQETPPPQAATDANRPVADLTSGAVVGVKSILGEIAGTRGKLHEIEIGGKHLYFNQGLHILTFLVANKKLGVYHHLLSAITADIEEANPSLANFRGGSVFAFSIQPCIARNLGS